MVLSQGARLRMIEPILRAQGINKSFGAVVASKNISLDLKVGEIHALIGPNGSGKSSFIRQIAGDLKPDAGQVHFNGLDVTSLSVAARARMGMGRTFQISSLAMDYTVLQNAMLGVLGRRGGVYRFFRPVMRDDYLLSNARVALRQVDLQDCEKTRTADLSHGQRRQLEVAVALALQPKAFLMDEPMAGLGVEGTHALVQLLETLKQRAPILLVEHDMDAVFALADRISVLVYGEIIATGSADDIRSNSLVRNAYLGEES